MIKLFACDLDGTLLNEKHETDEIILNSIEEVKKSNRYFSIATGRDLNSVLNKNNFHEIYIICMNGALICDPHMNILSKTPINKVFLKALLNKFPDLHIDCTGVHNTFVRGSKDKYIEDYRNQSVWNTVGFDEEIMNLFISHHIFNYTNEDILKEEILKVNFRVDDPVLTEEINSFLKLYDDLIVNAPFVEGVFEITDKSVNKGNAVKKLASLLNITEDEVAVYGDGGNDLDMLSMFKYSYATENASDEAKKCASVTIGNCKDHAVPYHMLKTIKK